jgi:hypothetical protein
MKSVLPVFKWHYFSEVLYVAQQTNKTFITRDLKHTEKYFT